MFDWKVSGRLVRAGMEVCTPQGIGPPVWRARPEPWIGRTLDNPGAVESDSSVLQFFISSTGWMVLLDGSSVIAAASAVARSIDNLTRTAGWSASIAAYGLFVVSLSLVLGLEASSGSTVGTACADGD